MQNNEKNTFGERVAAVVVILALVGGVACITYAAVWAKSDDRMLGIAGVGLIALALMYRWMIFVFPRLLEAKEKEVAKKAKEEARK